MKPIQSLASGLAGSALLLTAALLAPAAHAQIAFNGTYLQNFDSMGTTTAAPTGWSVYSEAGSHDTFSYFNASTGLPSTPTPPNLSTGALTLQATLTVVTGPTTSKGAGGYNFATAAAPTDRALGTSPSGIAAAILRASFTNNTGTAITDLALAYDIRRFTTTVNNNGYPAADPNATTEEYPGYQLFYSLNGGTTWTNVSSLNPTLAGPGGFIVPNSIGVTNVSASDITLSSAWAAGSVLQLAWLDDNAQGPSPDQLLGLDNVVISQIPEPADSALVLGLAAIGGLVALRRRRQA